MSEAPPQPPSFRALFLTNLRVLGWSLCVCLAAWLIYQAYDWLF